MCVGDTHDWSLRNDKVIFWFSSAHARAIKMAVALAVYVEVFWCQLEYTTVSPFKKICILFKLIILHISQWVLSVDY